MKPVLTEAMYVVHVYSEVYMAIYCFIRMVSMLYVYVYNLCNTETVVHDRAIHSPGEGGGMMTKRHEIN